MTLDPDDDFLLVAYNVVLTSLLESWNVAVKLE